jgi:hypothetical protein
MQRDFKKRLPGVRKTASSKIDVSCAISLVTRGGTTRGKEGEERAIGKSTNLTVVRFVDECDRGQIRLLTM